MTQKNEGQSRAVKQLKRTFFIALGILPVTSAIAFIWGWEHAFSAIAGGATILLMASATFVVINGGLVNDPKQMGKKIAIGLSWRLILLVVSLYAMLLTPWVKLFSLMAGLSVFFPAIVAEFIIQQLESKPDSKSA